MRKADPEWLPEARALCSRARITILGWGPDMLTVEAKSPQRVREITSQLSALGFQIIDSQDDVAAGMLSLSRNPDAGQAKKASFAISRRPWQEQIEPVIWALGGAGLFTSLYRGTGAYSPLFFVVVGTALVLLFLWDALRIWGWRLEILPEGLRLRRAFRWREIPWTDIRAVESAPALLRRLHARARNQEVVTLQLVSNSSERVGTFVYVFARNLRDRLRLEIAQRQNSISM